MKKKQGIALIVLALWMLMLAPTPVKARTPASFSAQVLKTNQIEQFRYWLYIPEDPQPGMPLIVYLHGGSGKGEDLSLITGVEGFPQYLQSGQLGDIRAYVVMPQLPSDQKGWPNAGESLMQLIAKMKSDYGVDPENISLTGHSMGGTGTWSVALSYPATFARIAPLSGSIKNNELNLNKLKNIPIRACVGSEDTIVTPESTIEFVAALQALGADAQVTVFSGASHFDVPGLGYLDPAMLDWLIDAKVSVDGRHCASLQEAMTLGTELRLLADVETILTLTGDFSLDLAGYDLTGTLITGDYRIFCKDSATDGLAGDYGTVVKAAGITALPGYLQADHGETVSFHRLTMELTAVSLRCNEAGVYYHSRFGGDAWVRSAVAAYGLILSIQEEPTLENGAYTRFTDTTEWENGEVYCTGTLLRGILKAGRTDVQNGACAETIIYSCAYVQLYDGTLLRSEPYAVTFRQLLEGTDSLAGADMQWDTLTALQKEMLTALYREFSSVMATWSLINLKKQ